VFDSIDKLTAAMSAGDERAVEAFYRRYFAWLYSQARRACRRDEAFCLDVVQDSVLRIIRNIRPVDTENELLAWLRLVVRATACDLLRSERRRQRRETEVVASQSAIANSGNSADESRDEDQRAWLRRKIAQFDPQLVLILDLRYQKSLTLGRIAEMLGLSLGTIDGRLRRALKHLRELAAEELND
jgi:RNA polymerase sigma-70 factor (ECF subfamily)